MDATEMELAGQIKKHRQALGISQEALAEKIYVSRQTISNWETARTYPDVQSLLLLSVAFDISIDELIKETWKPWKNPSAKQTTALFGCMPPKCY